MGIIGNFNRSAIDAGAAKGKYAVVPLPGAKPGSIAPAFAGGNNLGIMKSTKHRTLAVQFAELLAGRKYQVKLYDALGNLPTLTSARAEVVGKDPFLKPFIDTISAGTRFVPAHRRPGGSMRGQAAAAGDRGAGKDHGVGHGERRAAVIQRPVVPAAGRRRPFAHRRRWNGRQRRGRRRPSNGRRANGRLPADRGMARRRGVGGTGPDGGLHQRRQPDNGQRRRWRQRWNGQQTLDEGHHPRGGRHDLRGYPAGSPASSTADAAVDDGDHVDDYRAGQGLLVDGRCRRSRLSEQFIPGHRGDGEASGDQHTAEQYAPRCRVHRRPR